MFTQKELARRLEIDPDTLGKWEQGKRQLSKETVEKLNALMESLPPATELFVTTERYSGNLNDAENLIQGRD